MIARWARSGGYYGIKYIGDQGSADYKNIRIFQETLVENGIQRGVEPLWARLKKNTLSILVHTMAILFYSGY